MEWSSGKMPSAVWTLAVALLRWQHHKHSQACCCCYYYYYYYYSHLFQQLQNSFFLLLWFSRPKGYDDDQFWSKSSFPLPSLSHQGWQSSPESTIKQEYPKYSTPTQSQTGHIPSHESLLHDTMAGTTLGKASIYNCYATSPAGHTSTWRGKLEMGAAGRRDYHRPPITSLKYWTSSLHRQTKDPDNIEALWNIEIHTFSGQINTEQKWENWPHRTRMIANSWPWRKLEKPNIRSASTTSCEVSEK